MQCQSCGNSLPKRARICPSCGEEVSSTVTVSLPRGAVKTGILDYAFSSELSNVVQDADVPATVSFKCRKCDNDLKGHARFCSICGASVDPTVLSRALNAGRASLKSSASYLEQLPSWLADPLLILHIVAAVFLLAAIVQFVISLDIDSESNTAIIYHLRTVEFLLVTLIAEIGSLVFRASRSTS